jgi:hypothetical protein
MCLECRGAIARSRHAKSLPDQIRLNDRGDLILIFGNEQRSQVGHTRQAVFSDVQFLLENVEILLTINGGTVNG